MMTNTVRNLRPSRRQEGGFTLTELLVALSLAGIMGGVASTNLMELSNPSLSAASEIASYLKRARARALATTSAYTVSASSTDTLQATVGDTCAAAQTADPSLSLTIDKASLTNIAWSVCFTSRGFPDGNVVIPVADLYAGSNTVEVMLGGSIVVQ
ncbi:prepilin-type N-terminal cleavage/methylation domain-containing protein [bacterium]|nr:prepilin-type N-terminal cleavage/methylation domain-containing protein [bacterium]